MTKEPAPRERNDLLRRLSAKDYQRLEPHLSAHTFGFRDVLYEAREPIDYLYFPYNAVLSAVTLMEDGSAIEVATIGREGAAGLMAFLGRSVSPHRVFAQVAGEGSRIEASVMQIE